MLSRPSACSEMQICSLHQAPIESVQAMSIKKLDSAAKRIVRDGWCWCAATSEDRGRSACRGRDRLMKPAGPACNYLVCQTHYREDTYFQYAAAGLRNKAVSWIMKSSGPDSGMSGAGVVLMKLICLAWLRQGSGPSYGGSTPRITQCGLRITELNRSTLTVAVLLQNLFEQCTRVALSPQHTRLVIQTLLISQNTRITSVGAGAKSDLTKLAENQ